VIDFTLSQLMMRICAVLLISTLQGCALAMAAAVLGDAGPKHDGRLSIDPLRHVDLLGGAVALVFSIGWARWVAIDPRALRHGRFDLVLVVLAGFAAIVLGVLGLRFARPFLLPLPPLAGGHLLVAAVPKLRERLGGVQLFLGLIVAALVAAGMVNWVLDPAFRFLLALVLGEDVSM
jgi:hypothetical protein